MTSLNLIETHILLSLSLKHIIFNTFYKVCKFKHIGGLGSEEGNAGVEGERRVEKATGWGCGSHSL